VTTRSASEHGDIIIREERRRGTVVYVLFGVAVADQYLFDTRKEAVAQAIAIAKCQHVRAWFAKGDSDFVLLGTFGEERMRTSNLWR
jgi:hypothetical protein